MHLNLEHRQTIIEEHLFIFNLGNTMPPVCLPLRTYNFLNNSRVS
jgi:hypothetical protein